MPNSFDRLWKLLEYFFKLFFNTLPVFFYEKFGLIYRMAGGLKINIIPSISLGKASLTIINSK